MPRDPPNDAKVGGRDCITLPAISTDRPATMPFSPIHISGFLLACAGLSMASPAHARCELHGEATPGLEQWRSSGFPMSDEAQRNARAIAMTACLGEADPFLRDDIAFGALSTWMRHDQLDTGMLVRIEQALEDAIAAADADGFGRSFAALALAEVARTDRLRPWMTPQQRSRMATLAADYLRSTRDYRGYVDGEGWRHAVAHGADWAMQLILNKALATPDAMLLLEALATQVMSADGHAYVYGEPGRLARPVAYAAARGDLDQAAMGAWLEQLATALGPMPSGPKQSQWWLRRGNLENFLHALGHMLAGEQAPGLVALAASVDATLAKLH
jgi:hypothetical protein